MKSLLSSKSTRILLIAGGAVVLWFAVAETATEAWYRYKESQVPETRPWQFNFPDPGDPSAAAARGFYNFETRELGEREKEILRFKDGMGATWRDPEGNQWNSFYLEWDADKRLNQNDASHNPTACLPAAGLKMVRELPKMTVPFSPQPLSFRVWEFEAGGRPLFVYMAARRTREVADLTYTRDRVGRWLAFFERAIEGTRGNPLQVIQFFVVGPTDVDAANALIAERVEAFRKG